MLEGEDGALEEPADLAKRAAPSSLLSACCGSLVPHRKSAHPSRPPPPPAPLHPAIVPTPPLPTMGCLASRPQIQPEPYPLEPPGGHQCPDPSIPQSLAQPRAAGPVAALTCPALRAPFPDSAAWLPRSPSPETCPPPGRSLRPPQRPLGSRCRPAVCLVTAGEDQNERVQEKHLEPGTRNNTAAGSRTLTREGVKFCDV